MRIISTSLRAVIERVTEIDALFEESRHQLYVFEHLGKDGKPYDRWIQNWECDDVTYNFTREEREAVYKAVDEHYKTN